MTFATRYRPSHRRVSVLMRGWALMAFFSCHSPAIGQTPMQSEAFKLRDSNADGLLTSAEFLAPVDKTKQPAAARDFKVFDGNQDGSISVSEFQQIPNQNDWRLRLAGPDPVVAFAARLRILAAVKLKEADKNSDGQLSATEFQQSGFASSFPGLELSQMRDWDADQNGLISFAEMGRVVNATAGVNRLDGLHYREPSGIVHFAMLFTHADANHDDQLSRAEYTERGFEGASANATFGAADSNHDEMLSFQVFISFPNWNRDSISDFLKYDTDFDGQVSKSELTQGVPDYQRALAAVMLPAFDTDRNQLLSLAEYRLTPLANMIAKWHELPSDKNADRRIALDEFYQFPTIELAALSRHYFQLFDLNSDGYLGQNEFAFNVDLTRVSIDVAFVYRDQNRDQMLTLDEVQVDLLAAAKNSNDPGIQNQLTRFQTAFQAADKNGDRRLSQEEAKSELAKVIFQTAAVPSPMKASQTKPTQAQSPRPNRIPTQPDTF
ncbi:MAG: translocation protein TolB, partial [Planctomycetaceae bacterium]|nr:translocation protein TolB [Planctomycetaceae bacterium]